MVRVVIIDDYMNVAQSMADWAPVKAQCQLDVIGHPFADEDEAARLLAPYEIISTLRERTPFPRSLLARLPNLKLICTTGSMHRTLDHAAAAELGILVCCSQDRPGAHQGTPELAFGHILSLARRIPMEDRRIRQGVWQSGVGITLAGKTLGIVGLGKIGSSMARIGTAFGMKLLAWSPNLTQERASAAGAQLVDKSVLFQTADFITVHLVLSERTKGIIGRSDIKAMKPSAFFINTARGPLVDEAALVEALQSKSIAGVGLDVFHQEPTGLNHPLYAFEEAVLTPHLGYVVDDSFRAFYEDTVDNILAYLKGAPVRVRNSPPQA